MSIPAVKFNQLDNQIGIINDADRRLAVAGVCSQGPINTPGIFALRSDLVAKHGTGTAVEEAALCLETTGMPILFVRTGDSVAGAYTAVVETGSGTSVVTTDSAVEPYDDYEAVIKFITGGTVGVAGITYQESLDGGRSWGAVKALGTANTITIADGNVKFNLGAGTIIALDTASTRTSGPQWNNTELAGAVESLVSTGNKWNTLLLVGPVVQADVATLDAKGVVLENVGKERTFITSFRYPNIGESEQTYLAAFRAAFDATVATRVCVAYGAVDAQSPISQRRYLRRPGVAVACRSIVSRPGQDLAEKGEPSISPLPPTFRILDDANNPKHHDELFNPGADDARATTLRTWPGSPGVFITNARMLSSPGSDFEFLQHRDVMNLARETVRAILEKYSSADLLVDETTGFLLEEEAGAIDAEIDDALEQVLVETRNASAASWVTARADNILSTKKLRGVLKVTPLAYAKQIEADVGFFNPALRAVFPEED
jgi:hypothetical protein